MALAALSSLFNSSTSTPGTDEELSGLLTACLTTSLSHTSRGRWHCGTTAVGISRKKLSGIPNRLAVSKKSNGLQSGLVNVLTLAWNSGNSSFSAGRLGGQSAETYSLYTQQAISTCLFIPAAHNQQYSKVRAAFKHQSSFCFKHTFDATDGSVISPCRNKSVSRSAIIAVKCN